MLDYYNGLALALNPDDACARRREPPSGNAPKGVSGVGQRVRVSTRTVREQSGRKPHHRHDECV